MRGRCSSLLIAMVMGIGGQAAAASAAHASGRTPISASPPAVSLGIDSTCVVGPLNQVICIPDSPDNTICTIHLSSEFNGVEVNGVISGTWTADASTSCNIPMRFLEVTSSISGVGGSNSGPTDVCGLQVNTPQCTHVDSPDSLTCAACNGQWTVTGDYLLQFPFPVTTLTYDPSVCHPVASDELSCTVMQGATLVP